MQHIYKCGRRLCRHVACGPVYLVWFLHNPMLFIRDQESVKVIDCCCACYELLHHTLNLNSRGLTQADLCKRFQDFIAISVP